ncbi:hypothetical protein GF337_08495 [candidate division KSB1 bacterium]|nr:hypothetical protein [candidate division KSB1 bacterium]
MWNRLKSVGFVVLVLIVSAGFYWLIFMDKQQKEDSLDFAMNLLGDKLLAMIPEESNKQPVADLFSDFSKRAANREISPERVEYVAASIFNLSNNEATLSPEEAQALLNFSISVPLDTDSLYQFSDAVTADFDTNREGTSPVIARPPKPPSPDKFVHPYVSPEKWENLARKISRVNQFDKELQHSLREKEHNLREIRYRIDKDLMIELDAELKQILNHKELKQLAREMRELEREKMLEWRENFDAEFRHEMRELRRELQNMPQLEQLKELHKLHELRKSGHQESLKALESLESLEHLKSLEKLKHMPAVDPDSIEKIVRESLKAAGLDTVTK